ncbi:Menin [Cichlidogyrus casuarinus]|uniref:Menin n=1 Tax=Cichlidogyrus casuarinus TaxID=1844966 RepID=A0ABD2QBS4_9PLAT
MSLKDILSSSIQHFKALFPIKSVEGLVNFVTEFLSVNLKVQITPENDYETTIEALKTTLSLLKSNLDNETPNEHGYTPTQITTPDSSIAFASFLLGMVEDCLTNNAQQTASLVRSRTKRRISAARNVTPLTIDTCLSDTPSPSSNTISLASASSGKTSSPVAVHLPRERRASGSTAAHGKRKRNVSSASVPERGPLKPDHEPALSVKLIKKYDSGHHSAESLPPSTFPVISFEQVCSPLYELAEQLAQHPHIQPICDALPSHPGFASQTVLSAIIEVLQTRLNYQRCKDNPSHAQSLYSLLTHGCVDGFGLAFSVMAVAHMLGLNDVRLMLSEDHVWLEFGALGQAVDISRSVYIIQQQSYASPSHSASTTPPPQEMLLPVVHEGIKSSWLYVRNCPVRCDGPLSGICASIVAMQPTGPTLSPTSLALVKETCRGENSYILNDWVRVVSPTKRPVSSPSSVLSSKMIELKHRLLWLLYANHLLARYPLGITNLADLEETFPRLSEEGQPEEAVLPLALYYQAIHVDRCYFADSQV